MGVLRLVTALLRQLLQSRVALVAENLALPHQIVILQRSLVTTIPAVRGLFVDLVANG